MKRPASVESFEGLVRPRLCLALDQRDDAPVGDIPAWMRPLLAHRRSAKLARIAPETLPALYDRDHARLPQEVKAALLQTLRYTTHSSAHSSSKLWLQLLEPSSAGRFAEALVRHWAGALLRDEGFGWAVWSARILGDVQCLAVAAMVAVSPARNAEERELLLRLLQSCGMWGEVLLSVLASHPREEIADSAASKVSRAILERARSQWDFAGGDFLDEHEELAHALGVDAGSRSFPLDGEAVSVMLDPYGVPVLLGGVGDGMPPTNDVEALARFDADHEALALWFALESLDQLVARQADLFERMMSERVAWQWETWRALFLENRTFAAWSLGVLWCAACDDGEPRFFRVCEDQTLADIEDDELVGRASWEVSIAHPTHLTEPQRAAWMEIFASYERVAPFDQLGQPREALGRDEVLPSIKQLAGKTVDIRALRKKRWKQCVIEEAFSSYVPQNNIFTHHMLRVIRGGDAELFLGVGFRHISGEAVVLRAFLRSGGIDDASHDVSAQDLSDVTLLRLTEALREVSDAFR